jgi:hypothetical protein
MAYKTGLLAITLNNVDETMLQVKGYVQNFRTASLAGPVGASSILDLYSRLRTNRQELATLAAVPGLAAYAREQKNDENFDIVVEFNAVLAAIDGVTAWINTNFPKDGSGFLLAQTLGANAPADRQFTTAALAVLRTQLDTIIAAIN